MLDLSIDRSIAFCTGEGVIAVRVMLPVEEYETGVAAYFANYDRHLARYIAKPDTG